MPIRKRKDAPGEWFHVMNRALGRRTMFEHSRDMDYFLRLLGEAVAKGWVEVHGYTLMTTHFHLLVRSPAGELARALRHVELGYVLYFNRTRGRDGPMMRNRYHSKRIDSNAYRGAVLHYIDWNAPKGGLAKTPWDYPFCSCRHHMHGTGPDWLCRGWVMEQLRPVSGSPGTDAGAYAVRFLERFSDDHFEMVDRCLHQPRESPAPVDSLLESLPNDMLRWLRERTRLADGTAPGVSIAPPAVVERSVGPGPERSQRLAFLLRQLSGLTFAEIGQRLGCSGETARRRYAEAKNSCTRTTSLAEQLGQEGLGALVRTYGRGPVEN